MQTLLPLTHTVTTDQVHSLICIPDRDTAECEVTSLRHEHGPCLVKTIIRKDRVGKGSTYTLRYIIRKTTTKSLF
jgi:hypothetical protein